MTGFETLLFILLVLWLGHKAGEGWTAIKKQLKSRKDRKLSYKRRWKNEHDEARYNLEQAEHVLDIPDEGFSSEVRNKMQLQRANAQAMLAFLDTKKPTDPDPDKELDAYRNEIEHALKRFQVLASEDTQACKATKDHVVLQLNREQVQEFAGFIKRCK